jgi:diaminohydroxyphosphoribosylaminopyrimidine deaminase/5-amino-6-(5-phosphoribosylamino)uracil reductase
MKIALSLAARGRGMTHPNPMVGAVVVKNGRIVGKGFHKGPGTPHAEAEALRQAGHEARGSHLYVNLEPCNHQGMMPPCTEAIMRSGVKRVVFSVRDPNPRVEGGGGERLREAGIRVEEGIMEKEAKELNAAYLKYVTTGRPLVILKAAITADGKVATRSGASKWISGEKARIMAHRMRRESDAVMVGRGTVAADDPQLTVRMVPLRGAKAPLRVIVDSTLSMDLNCRLAAGGDPKVVVATTASHDRNKARELRKRGVEVMVLSENKGHVNLEELLIKLGKAGVAHLLVEGGPILTASFLSQGLADRLALFVAPKVFGDAEARSWMEGRVVDDPSQSLKLEWKKVRRLGEDLFLEADLRRR